MAHRLPALVVTFEGSARSISVQPSELLYELLTLLLQDGHRATINGCRGGELRVNWGHDRPVVAFTHPRIVTTLSSP